jgi:hypothetical protein
MSSFFDVITKNMRQSARKAVSAAGKAIRETCPICGNRRKIRHDKMGLEVDCPLCSVGTHTGTFRDTRRKNSK